MIGIPLKVFLKILIQKIRVKTVKAGVGEIADDIT